jgi:hypothetical protein
LSILLNVPGDELANFFFLQRYDKMVHLSVKLHQQLRAADVDWDRYTVLIEDGSRKRWTKLAEPSAWDGTKDSPLGKKRDATSKTDDVPKPDNTRKLDNKHAPIVDRRDQPITILPNELVEKILKFVAGNFLP